MQNRGALPATSHDLAEFGQLSGGASSLQGLASVKPPVNGAIYSSASGTGGGTPAIGVMQLGILYVPGGTYNAAILRISTGQAGALVKAVAYKADPNNVLGTLLFDTATVSASGAGYVSIALPSNLVVPDPGYPVWLGLVNQGSAAASFWYAFGGASMPTITSAGNSADMAATGTPMVSVSGVTAAAPTSPTGATIGGNNNGPHMALFRSA